MENTIYIGKYFGRIKKSGVLDLPESRLRVLRPYVGTDTDGTYTDDRVTLVVEDGKPESKVGFWPYICKMEIEEAVKLRNALDKAINKSHHVDQLQELI